MSNDTINIHTHAKWVLAGEHAVMRGCDAIALPLTEYQLTITYTATDSPFMINFEGEYGETLRVLVWGAIHEALAKANISINKLQGEIKISNTIPMGAGLGFSAALCVAVGRLFIHLGYLNEIELFEFAKHLEDLFHGNSSGMDIASVVYSNPILFNKNGTITPIDLFWQPNFYLSYTQQHSLTIDCVNQVKKLQQNQPQLARSIDETMQHAVKDIVKALQQPRKTGEPLLINAIQQAADCFTKWNLTNPSMQQQIHLLKQAGALAVKPTGAGNGGYLLSLWHDTPPKNLTVEMIDALKQVDCAIT